MIRRMVLSSQPVPQTRRSAVAAVPAPFWPQAPVLTPSSRKSAPARLRSAIELPVDVFITNEAAIVRAALPGVDPEQLEVSVYRDTLTIGAQLPATPAGDAGSVTWLISELGRGSFQRTIRLPFQVEEEQVTAEFTNGLLELTLPKVEAEKPHRIEVQARPALAAGDIPQDETFAAD